VTVDGPPFSVPRYLHLNLGKQTQRNVARFRLHYHVLQVKTRSWEHYDGPCDKCGLQAIRDEKHALFLCPSSCMQMCSLRLQFADLFHGFPLAHKITVNQTGAFYFSQACSEDVFNFFQKQTDDSYRFISFHFIYFILFRFIVRQIQPRNLTLPYLSFYFRAYGYFFDGWCSPAT